MSRNEGVGVRLRHARKLRGMTQVQLAKASGVKQSTISELETGESKTPWGTSLLSLAQTLHVNAEWLANGDGDMDRDETPLPPDAVRVARDWLRLAPDVRRSVSNMIREMVKSSSAETDPVPDDRVEAAYGRPGRVKK